MTVGAAACKSAEQCLGKHLVRGHYSSTAGEGTRAPAKLLLPDTSLKSLTFLHRVTETLSFSSAGGLHGDGLWPCCTQGDDVTGLCAAERNVWGPSGMQSLPAHRP